MCISIYKSICRGQFEERFSAVYRTASMCCPMNANNLDPHQPFPPGGFVFHRYLSHFEQRNANSLLASSCPAPLPRPLCHCPAPSPPCPTLPLLHLATLCVMPRPLKCEAGQVRGVCKAMEDKTRQDKARRGMHGDGTGGAEGCGRVDHHLEAYDSYSFKSCNDVLFTLVYEALGHSIFFCLVSSLSLVMWRSVLSFLYAVLVKFICVCDFNL